MIHCRDTYVVVDCGFSLKRFKARLADLELDAEQINSLLITHEHGDHAQGVLRVNQKLGVPLLSTVGTARTLNLHDYRLLQGGVTINISDALAVTPVTVPHDAAEPVQFVFTDLVDGTRLGVLTDVGHITQHLVSAYAECHGLLLEFNYDEEMMQNSTYPAHLINRITGRLGHLSNSQSMSLLEQLDVSKLRTVIAAHLSENNNCQHRVGQLLDSWSVKCNKLIASQEEGLEWVSI